MLQQIKDDLLHKSLPMAAQRIELCDSQGELEDCVTHLVNDLLRGCKHLRLNVKCSNEMLRHQETDIVNGALLVLIRHR